MAFFYMQRFINILLTITAKFVGETTQMNFVEDNEEPFDNLNYFNVNVNDDNISYSNDSDFHFLTDSFELLN